MSAQAIAPIRSDDLVSEVLSRDETLVEVFARRSPHFGKLRSRTLRRVMARLVTVGQAARMAGISSAELLDDLNDAIGARGESVNVHDGAAPPDSAASDESPGIGGSRPVGAPEVELDVRDDLRVGREPFSRIMAGVAHLRDGEVLHLRTTFEPVPLFAVLAKRGFVHQALARKADDWSIWFWRGSPDGNVGQLGNTSQTKGDDYVAAANERLLDVRQLEPPEPMMRTLAALETLPDAAVLVQVNRRLPQFLFPLLAERGYACTVDDSQPERILVRIWRQT